MGRIIPPSGGNSILGFPHNLDPRIPASAAAWPAANRCVYQRLREGGTISGIVLEVGTSSGNISVAVYSNSGSGRSSTPGSRLATSGAVACPAAGVQTVALGATVTVRAGDWVALTCDNATATFTRVSAIGSALVNGAAGFEAAQHPAPATPGALTATGYHPLLLGA